MKFENLYGVVAAAVLLVATVGCGESGDTVIDPPAADTPAVTEDAAVPADEAAPVDAAPATEGE